MHGISVRTVSLTRHSLAAEPFVAGTAVTEPPIGSGFAGGVILTCDDTSFLSMPDYVVKRNQIIFPLLMTYDESIVSLPL